MLDGCLSNIRDMRNLPDSIRNEFERQGHWVFSKTNNAFTAIPVDQGHEKENASVKESSGCIGLTENLIAFRPWMISGPELARLQKQLKLSINRLMTQNILETFQIIKMGMQCKDVFKSKFAGYIQYLKKWATLSWMTFLNLLPWTAATVWMSQ